MFLTVAQLMYLRTGDVCGHVGALHVWLYAVVWAVFRGSDIIILSDFMRILIPFLSLTSVLLPFTGHTITWSSTTYHTGRNKQRTEGYILDHRKILKYAWLMLHCIYIPWKISNGNINLIKLILRACLIFLFMYFMLNLCCTDNEQNWPNLHFDFALSP